MVEHSLWTQYATLEIDLENLDITEVSYYLEPSCGHDDLNCVQAAAVVPERNFITCRHVILFKKIKLLE